MTSLDAVYRFISVDVKTIRGNRGKDQKSVHIVMVYYEGHHLRLGQVLIDEKTNENGIVAISQLVCTIAICKGVEIIDVIGTQTIIKYKVDCCLVVMGILFFILVMLIY